MNQKGYLALAAGFAMSLGVSANAVADGHADDAMIDDVMADDSHKDDERKYNRKYISAMGSYVVTDDDRNVDNAWGGDLRLGKELSEFWNLELSGAVYDEMNVTNANRSDSSTHEEWSLGLNALYFFKRGDRWQPYAAGALGWSRARIDAPGFERRDFPYLGLALGSIMPIHDSGAAVRFDVQYRWDLVEAGSGSSKIQGNGNNNTDVENFGDWIINLGVVLPLPQKRPHHCCQPAVVAAPAPAVVIDPGVPNLPTFTIKDVHFAHDSSQLRPSAKVILDEVSSVLVANPSVNASVEGHASSPGSEAYNMALSKRRANIVRDYLVNKGVAKNHLVTKAFGETRPIASNDTEAGQAENRRVEIKAVNK